MTGLSLRSRLPNLPVQVYLDSADYSRLSDPFGDHREQLRATSILARGVEVGLIELRFSAAIIAEVCPTDPAAMEHGALRLRMVNQLCG
jgi:hypothetical protein